MTDRTTHHRVRDHFGMELATMVVLDDPTASYSGGSNLMDVIDDIDDRLATSSSYSSGSATVTSGNTAVTVSHGVSPTPSAADIVVTPTNNPTNDPGNFWVDTIGSTSFAINVRADPGVSGASFAWKVIDR